MEIYNLTNFINKLPQSLMIKFMRALNSSLPYLTLYDFLTIEEYKVSTNYELLLKVESNKLSLYIKGDTPHKFTVDKPFIHKETLKYLELLPLILEDYVGINIREACLKSRTF